MRNLRLAGWLLCVVLVGLSPVFGAGAPPEGVAVGETRPLFPEPFEQEMLRMARLEDQVVYLFRERMTAEHHRRQNKDAVINGYLVKGLDRLWRVKSVEARQAAGRGPEAFVAFFPGYVAKLPAKADLAAFSFFLSQLPQELTGLSGLAPKARETAQDLEKGEALGTYVAEVARTKDFFRHALPWQKWGNAIEAKIEGMLAKLQEKVSLEDAILALHWLSANSSGKVAQGAGRLIGRLQKRIARDIGTGLEAELAVGLEPDSVMSLELGENGLVIKQALYRGRIRVFVKALQTVKDRGQLDRFLPVCREVKGLLARLAPAAHDARSRATLERMQQNLDQILTVMGMRTRTPQATDQKEVTRYREVESLLGRIDPEGILLQ
ncbi:MAG: hypothetical protein GX442_25440 [Candidatus Riflebacteria bacterium]|nr:hypothetical protein [Candidatus Riflebacteria bacterium]